MVPKIYICSYLNFPLHNVRRINIGFFLLETLIPEFAEEKIFLNSIT